ncbi:glycosyl hydrolase family 18 protein [Paenibacillus chondroitinus]|uniref:Glycosyl hydrolase family 18 protein n=1 Tax=Paenibacillus chondroitinus TaxID=59842 RepID=A0ABU6DIS5_9BACL|nr:MULTISPECIES: glycosyl hydrolase family 18 protein [Paenibacillus]MCY9663315.1 glycosyl hydrolase family 18 protein [Paenibacillus anseongense]MEB4796761.1 glycosyl hydrolase family 18 protein [Paenibacillus chondroitinus]
MQQRRRSSKKILLISSLIIGMFAAGAASFLWEQFAPNRTKVETDYHELSKPIFYQGNYYKLSAIGEKEGLKLPLELIQEWIDPSILYEKSSDSVIITTKDKVLRLKTTELSALMNEKPITLSFPVEKKGSDIYVPIEPLRQLYPFEIRESDQTGAVLLFKKGETLKWGKRTAAEAAQLRTFASIKAPIVSSIAGGEQVILLGEEEEWYRVQQASGPIGYVRKTDIQIDHDETIPIQEDTSSYVPWKPPAGKLNLTWEHVISKNPDTTKIGEMPGLQVVSPTWFSISDGEGRLKNLADASYVKWAQTRNYQVWALFSNGFDPDVTNKALSTYDSRMKIIKQLLGFAQTYKLQGFNIDFENVYLKDKENLVQFVREMTPFMHEQGLAVSIDVTPKSTNEMWSMFYDRTALAEVVDYMMVMAYDEYWATSPKSGSVSSLPWTESSVKQILNVDKVPPSKLVLGVPFYTRQWTEEMKNGKLTATSKTLTMEAAAAIIKDKKLTPTYLPDIGQNYVEYKDGEKLIRIWLEDETSMKARLDLVKKYDLAGVATWRRGFEQSPMWKVIQDGLVPAAP